MEHARAVALVVAVWAGTSGLIAGSGGSPVAPPLRGDRPAASAVPRGRVEALESALRNRAGQITFTPISGYLPGLLDALHVSPTSQVAVFSRTSAQTNLISPENPRVIYFSDDVAVGWVRGSSVIEVAAFDSHDGAVFYTVDQDAAVPPRFTRNDHCRTCHESGNTLGVPGLLVLSTPEAYGAGANLHGSMTDHRTLLSERWGGWYVTGLSRGWKHLGNRVGQGWLASLYDQFDDIGYPTQYSDVVALMILEHMAHMTNLMTRLGRQVEAAGDVTADVRHTVDELVDYMLFVDEAPLPGPIVATSGYAEYFSGLGPRDSRGRSLRDLDLRQRLFRYPCSYMIYSPAFDALPAMAKDAVFARLVRTLSSRENDETHGALSNDMRKAVLEILSETKPEFLRFRLGRRT